MKLLQTIVATVALLLAAAPATVMLAPAEAVAAGDAAPGGDHAEPVSPVPGLIRHTVNLALLLTLLFVLLKGPTRDFLAFRRSQVKEQLDASWDAKQAADSKYAELQGRLDNFDAELAELMAAVKADADTERARIVEQAERSAAQLEAAAKRTIDEEMRRAHTELRDQTVELAVRLAAEMLSGAVDGKDQSRLSTDYLARVEEAAS